MKMKALFFNGSPRKNWNTDQLLQKAMEGAESEGFSCEKIQLYDYNFCGCVSCFACKRKGNSTNGICAYKDEMTDLLLKAQSADMMVFGSPVYINSISAQMKAFLERLLFPRISYMEAGHSGDQAELSDRLVPTGSIYTMNMKEAGMDKMQYKAILGANGTVLAMVYKYNEILYSCDTWQFDDYENYNASRFDIQEKANVHRDQFPIDCEKAYDMGKRLAAMAKEKEGFL